jgi:type VI secretion system secreted protein Hcp
MAVDMFLKLDGVNGESKDKVHGKEIDVLSWSWGMTNSGSAH